MVLCGLLAAPGPLFAHPDLLLQIEQLDQAISADPHNAELLARRGDLHRRHQDYAAAAADLEAARDADPDYAPLDFIEGELFLDTGQPDRAAQSLTRYLASHPGHAAAWTLRARAWLGLGRPASAADDFQQGILVAENPAPELYRLQVLSLAAQGADRWLDALEVVNAGLERFPVEVSLLGLGADIALGADRSADAIDYIQRLPQKIQKLPQWETRLNRAGCIDQAGEPARPSCLRGAREDLDRQVATFLADHAAVRPSQTPPDR